MAGSGRPASRQASVSLASRAPLQPAGCVSVRSSRRAPLTRTASSFTRLSTAAIIVVTGTSASPKVTVSRSMRRFGLGSNRAGSSRAACTASRPTSRRPVRLRVHRARQQRRAVEEQRAYATVRPAQHGGRVGGAEVDAEPVAVRRGARHGRQSRGRSAAAL